jgi:hypothetical protein
MPTAGENTNPPMIAASLYYLPRVLTVNGVSRRFSVRRYPSRACPNEYRFRKSLD